MPSYESLRTVLIFGDSITAGYGLAPEDAFPALTEKILQEHNLNIEVINGGLSGETSAGGVARIDWMLRKPINVFMLELGANDALRGLSLTQTEKNLQTIIDKVLDKNPNVTIIIAGMLAPPNLGDTYISKFKSIYPRIAQKNNAILIPFLLEGVAGDPTLNLKDGIHPNANGHKKVAQLITPYIKNLFVK